MILAFYLSMPGCPSWNGKWSGEGNLYVIVKTFRSKKDIEKAERIKEKKYYSYRWEDGWMAGIRIEEVDSNKAKKLRNKSKGFCGYDWMVDTIIEYDRPTNSYEVRQLKAWEALDAFFENQC